MVVGSATKCVQRNIQQQVVGGVGGGADNGGDNHRFDQVRAKTTSAASSGQSTASASSASSSSSCLSVITSASTSSSKTENLEVGEVSAKQVGENKSEEENSISSFERKTKKEEERKTGPDDINPIQSEVDISSSSPLNNKKTIKNQKSGLQNKNGKNKKPEKLIQNKRVTVEQADNNKNKKIQEDQPTILVSGNFKVVTGRDIPSVYVDPLEDRQLTNLQEGIEEPISRKRRLIGDEFFSESSDDKSLQTSSVRPQPQQSKSPILASNLDLITTSLVKTAATSRNASVITASTNSTTNGGGGSLVLAAPPQTTTSEFGLGLPEILTSAVAPHPPQPSSIYVSVQPPEDNAKKSSSFENGQGVNFVYNATVNQIPIATFAHHQNPQSFSESGINASSAGGTITLYADPVVDQKQQTAKISTISNLKVASTVEQQNHQQAILNLDNNNLESKRASSGSHEIVMTSTAAGDAASAAGQQFEGPTLAVVTTSSSSAIDARAEANEATAADGGPTHSMSEMAAMLTQAVKNEPEDLTGYQRRDPTDGIKCMSTGSPAPTPTGAPLLVLSSAAGDIYSSSSPSIATSIAAGIMSSAGAGGPPGGQTPTAVITPDGGVSYVNTSGGDFFDQTTGRVISSAAAAAAASGATVYPDGTTGFRTTTDADLFHQSSPADGFLQYYGQKGGGVIVSAGPNGTPPHSGGPSLHHLGSAAAAEAAVAAATAAHLNSPDSGIGDGSVPNPGYEVPHGFDPTNPYPQSGPGGGPPTSSDLLSDLNNPGSQLSTGRRSWSGSDYTRQNEEKIHIPKAPYTPHGFKYTLESPSSSSVRKEDDRITYVNKGQFYSITLEYQPEPDRPPLKSTTVKTIIMVVFREAKPLDEELKAWQFWHSRQHSIKQRILDADTKNSMGLAGMIEEVSHNALAVYWNPMESPAKINIAVQCLSTDFSTQKGVKGMPLHLQIDTFDGCTREHLGNGHVPSMPVYHRGFCQIKVFCDKGAERKARDEERRANKRRQSTTGKRRLDEMFHPAYDRSEFYAMADLGKPPVLFTPSEDPEKSGMDFGTELPSFYTSAPPSASGPPPGGLPISGGSVTAVSSVARTTPPTTPSGAVVVPLTTASSVVTGGVIAHLHASHPHEAVMRLNGDSGPSGALDGSPVSPHFILGSQPPEKRIKLIPPPSERIMIYVRQDSEEAYTALHLAPPSVHGLIRALESKYRITAGNIRFLYRKTTNGIQAKIDDDMLKFFCNEDVYLMQVMVTEEPGVGEVYDITLTENPPPSTEANLVQSGGHSSTPGPHPHLTQHQQPPTPHQ